MKLAVNYSPMLLKLFDLDPGLPVDYIKVPTQSLPDCFSQFETGVCYRKLLPHIAQSGFLALGQPQVEQRYNAAILHKIIALTNPPHLSTHLEARVEFFPEFQEYQHLRDQRTEQRLLDHFVAAIKAVQADLGLPLLVENFPYYSWWCQYMIGSTPEFISAVCEGADCGFLLDLAHARCSADYQGRDLWEYLMALPLDRVREIHVSGTKVRSEGLRDAHVELTEEDYLDLKGLLERTNPEIVTIEYGGLPDKIQNLDYQFEPISRNEPAALLEMIQRVGEIVGAGKRQ